ncbi:MAG: DUF1566 domain-containing protein [Planctomycetota bacterium]|jgi:hypothetical protein
MRPIGRRHLGWLGVVVHLLVVGLWAWWGTIENFHEGWYRDSLGQNLAMMFGQYLSIPLVLTILALLALWRPGLGLAAYVVGAAFAIWFLSGAHFSVVYVWIVMPLVGLGLAFFFGRPEPVRWARRLVAALPVLIVLGLGIPLAVRVSKRIDDGNHGLREIAGNGVTLLWAPAGPGWPGDGGVDHAEALRRCRHLSADGTRLEEAPQDVWRLPTVDELVRSQAIHGENAGGTWDEASGTASYARRPDKETPLWRPKSPVIYLWSATPAGSGKAYVAVYHGGVFAKNVTNHGASFGFRAVRPP